MGLFRGQTAVFWGVVLSAACRARVAGDEGQIQSLTTQRDALVAQMIGLLNGAGFNGQSFSDAEAQSLIAQGQTLLNQANGLPQ